MAAVHHRERAREHRRDALAVAREVMRWWEGRTRKPWEGRERKVGECTAGALELIEVVVDS